MELTAGELAQAAGGRVIAGSPDVRASSYTIDSRTATAGACFFALRGARDGHSFVPDAFGRGATIAVVEQTDATAPHGAAAVRVADTMSGLTEMARTARGRLEHAVVVGITGSAGKTATKDLTAAALGRAKRVHASPGSFNNEAGVPLTLLSAPADAEVVVAEMGARFAGNIADLAKIAEPQVGVVTHVGLAHAGHLGGREGIARVKGELIDALPASGLAVLNADCDATPALAERSAARVVRVGQASDADVRVSGVTLDDELRPRFVIDGPWGSAEVQVPLRGSHQADNAAQAVTVAVELGVPLDTAVAGIADARSAAHRMDLGRTKDGVLVLNDAYNSSPTSAGAAVRSLAQLAVTGRRVAVLGEMLELGEQSSAEHAAIGALVADAGIDVLVAVGDCAADLVAGARRGSVDVIEVVDADAASRALLDLVEPGDAVLVKASRAVGLERVAAQLARGDDDGR